MIDDRYTVVVVVVMVVTGGEVWARGGGRGGYGAHLMKTDDRRR